MRRILAIGLALALLLAALPSAFAAEAKPLPMPLSEAVDGASAFLSERMTASGVYSDWSILQLARSGNLSAELRADYLRATAQTLHDRGGVLDDTLYTAYSRTALALTACGVDASNFEGYDLLAPLEDVETTVAQGVNGAAYALLALDCGGYGSEALREKLLAALLAAELPGGGWAQPDGVFDVDLTAMALQALAPYTAREEVGAAVERALTALSAAQQPDGGFVSQWGERSSESPAQVLLALCALGIDPARDGRFVQADGAWLGSAIFDFLAEGDGVAFGHTNRRPNYLATEQVGYVLAAYERFLAGLPFLYDMRDALPGHACRRYTDVDGHWAREAICAVTELGLMNGDTATTFAPEMALSRAMLVTVLYRAAGEPETGGCTFSDVPAGQWYTDAVAWAQENRIVNGVGDNRFAPEEPITREELATVLWRFCKAPDGSLPGRYADEAAVSDWAESALAWAVERGIVNGVEGNRLDPRGRATRAQTAAMLCRLIDAGLLAG